MYTRAQAAASSSTCDLARCASERFLSELGITFEMRLTVHWSQDDRPSSSGAKCACCTYNGFSATRGTVLSQPCTAEMQILITGS